MQWVTTRTVDVKDYRSFQENVGRGYISELSSESSSERSVVA